MVAADDIFLRTFDQTGIYIRRKRIFLRKPEREAWRSSSWVSDNTFLIYLSRAEQRKRHMAWTSAFLNRAERYWDCIWAKESFELQETAAKVYGPQSQSSRSILSRAERTAHRRLRLCFWAKQITFELVSKAGRLLSIDEAQRARPSVSKSSIWVVWAEQTGANMNFSSLNFRPNLSRIQCVFRER